MKRFFIAVMLLASATAWAEPIADPAATYSIPIEPSIDAVRGPADAKVTLVLATEYACPYCEKVHASIAELEKQYGKDLRVVERQFVVHPQVATAAAAAACAATRQGAFDRMDAFLWDRFRAREFDDTTCLADSKTCKHVADGVAQLKLDAPRFARDLVTCRTKIAEAQAAWQTAFHIQAIPTMWINGRHMQGAQPVDALAKIVDEELAKATAAIGKGAKAATYYADAVVARGVKTMPEAPHTPRPPTPPGPPNTPPKLPVARPEPDAAKTYAIAVLPDIDGIVGAADAKITLVVGSDYACVYCDKIRPTLDELAKKYGKDLRVVHRHFIVHPMVATAYGLAACAANRQHAFARMDAILWGHFASHELDQGECWTDPNGCANVNDAVAKLHLDGKRFARDMAACRQPIADAQATWTTAFGVMAIPGSFVNGRFISGAQPVETFARVIDEELAKATDRIAKGAKAATYYHDWVEAKGQTAL